MSYPGVRPIPRKVRYTYPNGHKRHGELLDRVELRTSGNGGSYLMVIEKIPMEGARKPTIRFGYYRKETSEKRWRWGSQTTFHFGKGKTERIIRKAIAKGFFNVCP